VSTNDVDWKTLIADLKKQWGSMWKDRLNDKLRAEGIAAEDYPQLFVEKGLIVTATRDFRPPTFTEIVKKHVPNPEKYMPPDPSIGGWGRFVRTALSEKNRTSNSRRLNYVQESRKKVNRGQPKKGGRGWLHR
jgi:hypothetical protein